MKSVINKLLELDWKEWCTLKAERNGDYNRLAPEPGQQAEHLQRETKESHDHRQNGSAYEKRKQDGSRIRRRENVNFFNFWLGKHGSHYSDQGI